MKRLTKVFAETTHGTKGYEPVNEIVVNTESICNFSEIVTTLGLLEDVLEEFELTSAEDLRNYLNFKGNMAIWEGKLELKNKIADLETKLKESESKRKSLEEKVKFLTEETEENFVDGQKYNELKQQLAEWQDGTIICKWTNAENKVKELEQQVEELEENYKRLLTCFYSANKRYFEILDKYEDINFKFKQEEQQLHDLPKKIVEEIKIEMGSIEDILINCGNGKEDALSWFNKILQTILKKYGGEDEN